MKDKFFKCAWWKVCNIYPA